MTRDPPPIPPRRFAWAYALAAAGIWAMAAFGLIVQKPPNPAWTLAAAGWACIR